MASDSIRSSIESLQQIYTVILALALAEAFKQFIIEDRNNVHRKVDWNKLLNLISLLALIIPFLHGMNRYFFDTYISRSMPRYGLYLLIDCIAFMIEGALFFILARSLSAVESSRFYRTVGLLLSFDVLWGGLIWYFHTPSVEPWVVVNLIFVFVIAVILIAARKHPFCCQILCALTVVLRTLCDYRSSWSFYFPQS